MKMRGWNLYDWYDHYYVLFLNYLVATHIKIKTMILNGNGWNSKCVSDWLDSSRSNYSMFLITNSITNYSHPKRFIGGTLHSVKFKDIENKNEHIREYTILYLIKHPCFLLIHVITSHIISYHVIILSGFMLISRTGNMK